VDSGQSFTDDVYAASLPGVHPANLTWFQGNLFEWVADWVPRSTTCGSWHAAVSRTNDGTR